MNGVEAAQEGAGTERCRGVKERGVEVDLVKPSQLTASLGYGQGTTGLHRAHDLDARQCACHPFVGSMAAQVASESFGLRLLLDQLHDGRGVQVQPQRSSSRIIASVPEASTSKSAGLSSS